MDISNTESLDKRLERVARGISKAIAILSGLSFPLAEESCPFGNRYQDWDVLTSKHLAGLMEIQHGELIDFMIRSGVTLRALASLASNNIIISYTRHWFCRWAELVRLAPVGAPNR